MIIDLRDYTTAAGARDKLIERCEGLVFDEQERLGATFIGSFRDAENPVRFVFLRGMRDHPIRSGEHGLVWFATFETYRPLELSSVEQRRLLPTARSRLR